jgi:HK97 family phage portal protein
MDLLRPFRNLDAQLRAPRVEVAEPSPTERRLLTPFGPWGTQNLSTAGVSVTASSATQLLAVHGCVALISDTIATLPLNVYRDDAVGMAQEVDSGLPRWLKQPNPTATFIDFVSQTTVSLLLDGNAYWIYSLDGNAMPAEIRVLDPTSVTVRAATRSVDSGPEYLVHGEVYRGNLVHLKGIIRPGALKGVSPLEDARQSIGLGLAAQDYAARFYSNGASLSGVIETASDLTLDQARDTVRKFAQDHSGLKNAHRPGLLDNGATWKPISVTPEQAQFLESRQYQTAEISSMMFLLDPAWFGMVPKGGGGLTYQNRAQLGEHLAQFTLARWLIRIEKAVSDLLPQPQYAKFNVDALKRGDLAARGAYYTQALNPVTGWMNRDEVRDLEDLGPDTTEPVSPAAVAAPLQSVPTLTTGPTQSVMGN